MLFKDEVRERRYIKKTPQYYWYYITIGNPLITKTNKKTKQLRDKMEEKYGNKDIANDYICLNERQKDKRPT